MSLDRRRFEALVDWREGRLAPEEAATVESWVETGEVDVVEALSWIDEFHRSVGSLHIDEPPPLVTRRLRRLIQPTGARAPLVRESAEIIEDSRSWAMAGMRGGSEDAYQLTASSNSAEVVLDVGPEGAGTVRIHGQVLPRVETEPAFEVRTVGGDREVCSVGGDDLGGFSLLDVPVEVTGIVATNDLLSIEVPLDLQNERTRPFHRWAHDR